MVESDVNKIIDVKRSSKPSLVTEDEIKEFPAPVKRYLEYTKIVGKEKIESVRLRYKGSFRMSEDQKWMPLKVEQYYTTDPPAFVWIGSIACSIVLGQSQGYVLCGKG
jgi:hypothetical protein